MSKILLSNAATKIPHQPRILGPNSLHFAHNAHNLFQHINSFDCSFVRVFEHDASSGRSRILKRGGGQEEAEGVSCRSECGCSRNAAALGRNPSCLGGSGGMLPRKILKIQLSKYAFLRILRVSTVCQAEGNMHPSSTPSSSGRSWSWASPPTTPGHSETLLLLAGPGPKKRPYICRPLRHSSSWAQLGKDTTLPTWFTLRQAMTLWLTYLFWERLIWKQDWRSLDAETCDFVLPK